MDPARHTQQFFFAEAHHVGECPVDPLMMPINRQRDANLGALQNCILLGRLPAQCIREFLAPIDVEHHPYRALSQVVLIHRPTRQIHPKQGAACTAHLQFALIGAAVVNSGGDFRADPQVLLARGIVGFQRFADGQLPLQRKNLLHGRVGPAHPPLRIEKGNAHHRGLEYRLALCQRSLQIVLELTLPGNVMDKSQRCRHSFPFHLHRAAFDPDRVAALAAQAETHHLLRAGSHLQMAVRDIRHQLPVGRLHALEETRQGQHFLAGEAHHVEHARIGETHTIAANNHDPHRSAFDNAPIASLGATQRLLCLLAPGDVGNEGQGCRGTVPDDHHGGQFHPEQPAGGRNNTEFVAWLDLLATLPTLVAVKHICAIGFVDQRHKFQPDDLIGPIAGNFQSRRIGETKSSVLYHDDADAHVLDYLPVALLRTLQRLIGTVELGRLLALANRVRLDVGEDQHRTAAAIGTGDQFGVGLNGQEATVLARQAPLATLLRSIGQNR